MALWHFMLNFALMNILLIGSGGRESAIAWSLSQSPELGELFIAPGNPGTLAYGNNVSVDWRQFVAMKDFCMNNRIDMVIVDLYPFEDTVASGASENDIIEKIDIGGIALIRAGAKNHQHVWMVSSRGQYADVLNILDEQGASTSLEQRRRFAGEAYQTSQSYDAAIAAIK